MKFEAAEANEIKFSNAKRANRSAATECENKFRESLNLFECKCNSKWNYKN